MPRSAHTCAAGWLVASGMGASTAGQSLPPPGLTIAFIGDQGLGDDAESVLHLIQSQGAHAVVHAGDFDYDDDPEAWDAMISGVLGPDFPYFAAVGNHDEDAFYGPGGYQEVLAQRMAACGMPWEGDLGARCSLTFEGIDLILTAPGLFGNGDTVYAPYIRSRLAASDAPWRISAWHVLMRDMQVGDKSDQSGWGVYEESRRGGAIIATAHEHSYARTHPLKTCIDQVVAVTDPIFAIGRDHPGTLADEGVTFAFHSGLGGQSIRDQERCLRFEPPYGCKGEWASIYTSDQGADHGALFGVFHVLGDPCLAYFYFLDVQGNQPDWFLVRSMIGPCGTECLADFDASGQVDVPDLIALLAQWGPCAAPCAADLDGSGNVGVGDLLELMQAWGGCP